MDFLEIDVRHVGVSVKSIRVGKREEVKSRILC